MNNQKDLNKLHEISDKFNEETLKDIFSKMHNGSDVTITGWDFGPASAKGDSYLSTIYKVRVDGTVDSEPTHIKIIIKSLPRNIARRKTFRSTEFFKNEITFYEKIVPKFKKFIQDKNQMQLLCVPTHLASLCDGENDYLVLEDVSPLGYGPVTRQSTVDFYQCSFILKTMAMFHAISFAYRDQKKEEFQTLADSLIETYYTEDLWSWYKNFHQRLMNITNNALSMEYPNSEATKKFASYKFGELYYRCINIVNRWKAPTSVILQGDSWAPNFLIKTINETEHKAMMLDFQLARCCSPVTDISLFIYSCTDKVLRDKYFDELLKIYHDKLSESIACLGSDPKKLYPWNKFMEEVKEQFLFGLVFATEAVPFCVLDESESFDLDTIKGDDAIDVSDAFAVTNIKTKSGRLRLADIIAHAVEKGYL